MVERRDRRGWGCPPLGYGVRASRRGRGGILLALGALDRTAVDVPRFSDAFGWEFPLEHQGVHHRVTAAQNPRGVD